MNGMKGTVVPGVVEEQDWDAVSGDEITILGFSHQGNMLYVVWCDDNGYIHEIPAHFVRMPPLLTDGIVVSKADYEQMASVLP